jgi:predicted nucleic acid-binding protein
MKLHKALRGRPGVVIDTMVWIYLFEDRAPFADHADYMIDGMQKGMFHGVVTPVTLGELIVKPLKNGREDIADRYRQAFTLIENMTIGVIDEETGWMAGSLQAKYNIALPDMIQAAAALRYDRPAMITHDKRLKKIEEVEVFMMHEAVV